MTGGYTMKENSIRELAKRMGLITVENMCQYTIAQLVVMVANKVNELIDGVGQFESDVVETVKTQNENIHYLLDEGLHLEVATVFDGWVKDGTFDTLINQSALNQISELATTTNNKLNSSMQLSKYKYLGTTFSAKSVDDPNTYLRVMLSDDGINWVVYSEYNDIAIRDPYTFKYKGYYYITGTNLLTHDKVGYLRTNDFKSFEHVQYEYTGLANFEYKWAPSVFNVGTTYYMIMSLSERDSVYGLNHYITELDNNLVPKRWVKLEGGDIPEWSYDGHIIPTKNAFYFYFKREGGMDILKSSELFGEYKKIDTIDWDNGREAPFIMKPDVNTIRLYMDKWEGEGQEVFKESYDDGVTWTEVKPINIKDGYFTPKHMHVIEINGDNWQPSFSYEKYQKITSKWGIAQCNNNVVDLNEVVSGGYLNRMTTPSTLNLPQNIDEDEYGCATLINMQNGNYIQHIHFLSQKQFIRSYVNGVWSTYKKITQTEDGQEEYLTFDMGLSCDGIVRVHYRCVRDLKVVNLQGSVSGIQSGINHIGTLDEKFRTKLWFQQLAFNSSNWDDVPPIVELLEDGKINVSTRGASTIKPTDKVSFNITYVV